jgi:hypothetical protein
VRTPKSGLPLSSLSGLEHHDDGKGDYTDELGTWCIWGE